MTYKQELKSQYKKARRTAISMAKENWKVADSKKKVERICFWTWPWGHVPVIKQVAPTTAGMIAESIGKPFVKYACMCAYCGKPLEWDRWLFFAFEEKKIRGCKGEINERFS